MFIGYETAASLLSENASRRGVSVRADLKNADETAGNEVDHAAAWLGCAPRIADEDCASKLETGILVVGAGCAGLFAACHAAEAGAKVLLIEANERGTGIRSSALGAVDSSYQRREGVHIEKSDIVNDIVSYALNFCNAALIRQWADYGGEAVDWYGRLIEPHGFTLCLEQSMPQGTRYRTWPTGHGTALASDTALRMRESNVTDILISHVESCGGVYVNETRLVSLVKEGGRVSGA